MRLIDRLRRARVLVFACVAGLSAASVLAQQDWKPSALASFDDAWQTIHDKFYDPAFGGVNWDAVRTELRPKAEKAASPDDVRRVIVDMIGRLHESHFTLLPSGGAIAESHTIGPAGVPIEVRVIGAKNDELIIARVEPDSTADRAGLRPGQMITAIDALRVPAILTAAPEISIGRERTLDAYREALRALHRMPDSTVALTVSDAGVSTTIHVTRVIEGGEVVTLGNLPPIAVRVDHRLVETPKHRHAGVIAFNVWLAQIDAPVASAVDEFRHSDGLIFDLRGNPGGIAAMMQGIAGHFMNDDTAVLGRMKMRDAELAFHPNPRRSTPDGRSVEPFAGPVAVLVDDLTGSTSECFTAGAQSLGRVRVFGRTTMGAALPANTKKLPDGDVLMYVVGDFVTGTGRRVEGNGVIPDEPIALTPEAFKATPDPDLAAALAWIDRGSRK